ncbi:TPA: hypothetical protein RU073_005299 [Klebsiella pneumoniae]|nr:hypothetical protein [Klebsiella pneumoniae]
MSYFSRSARTVYGYRYFAPDGPILPDNKSQRADPFVVLSRIIAGKTKYVKDPFSAQILHEASNDAG